MKITKESFANKMFNDNDFQNKIEQWLKQRQHKYNFTINWLGDKTSTHPTIDLTFECDRYNSANFEYNLKTGKVNFNMNFKYKENINEMLNFVLCINKMLANIKGFLTDFEKLQ